MIQVMREDYQMCSIKNSGSVAAIFMSCNLGILQYFTIFYIKNYFMSFF